MVGIDVAHPPLAAVRGIDRTKVPSVVGVSLCLSMLIFLTACLLLIVPRYYSTPGRKRLDRYSCIR